VKDGWHGLEKAAKKEVKEILRDGEVKVGDYFITEPGRFKRRGVKNIYHSTIKRLPSDYTSVIIVENALRITLRRVIEDGMKTVTMCGMGIEPGDLDIRSVARIMSDACKLFHDEINIKIIDDNKEFIKDLCKFYGDDCDK
jgi:O-acetyl-ADP-ribose deacetylase (regulator of RNase III)